MAKAHKFSASQVAVFPNVLKSQETIEPMIPGRSATALPAELARARPRACRCFFSPTLSNCSCQVAWEPAPAHFPPPPVSTSTRVGIAMPIAVRIDAMVIPCPRHRVRMRTASVVSLWRRRLNVSRILLIWDRRVALFVERALSLSFRLDVRECTLEVSDSVSSLSLHFSVVCFYQFSMLPGEVSFDLGFSVVDTRQLCQVVCQLISHSRHCLFEPSKHSSGLGDPRGVDWLIINRRSGGLNLFCALTCAVGYAGGVLEFDFFKGCSGGFFPPAGVLSQRSYSDLSRGWSGGAMVLGKLPAPGCPTILITVGQGPTALTVGAGGRYLDILTSSILSFLSPSL